MNTNLHQVQVKRKRGAKLIHNNKIIRDINLEPTKVIVGQFLH